MHLLSTLLIRLDILLNLFLSYIPVYFTFLVSIHC